MGRPTTTWRSRRPLCGALLGAWVAAGAAWAHGASKGLHLHLSPEPAARGETVTVELTAAEPVARARVGFVDLPPVEREPDPPSRTIEIDLEVPRDARAPTLGVQAEVRTVAGVTLRASAVLRVSDPLPPPEPVAPGSPRQAAALPGPADP